MSIVHIPSREIHACDSCGNILNGDNCRKRGKLTLKHQGMEVRRLDGEPEGDITMDLCDPCDHGISIAIRKSALACAAAMNNPWPAPQPVEPQTV